MPQEFLFTSESVSEGHPDKVADQISDGVLDAILAQDPYSRVACETLVTTGLVVLAGEITTQASVDFQQVARETIKRIGYDDSAGGFDYRSCAVMVSIDKQSPDIAQGVNEGQGLDPDQGAGDQGLMFGYACDETPQLMPAPIYYAHRLMQRQAEVRKNGQLPWLRPDAKSQVTFRYVDGKPVSVDAIVLSTQHAAEIEHNTLCEAVIDEIVKPVIPDHLFTKDTKYFINPTGRFVVGGPQGDCGLTGRKIIVDTYGGAAHSPGRIPPRWTAPRPTRAVTWRRTSLPPVSPAAAKCRWPTPSALPGPCPSWSTPSVPAPCRTRRSPNWCRTPSTCVPRASS